MVFSVDFFQLRLAKYVNDNAIHYSKKWKEGSAQVGDSDVIKYYWVRPLYFLITILFTLNC